jgi:hypothetical protein
MEYLEIFGIIFLVQAIIAILLVEFALHGTKPVWEQNQERDQKYPMFRRYDLKNWTRINLYPPAVLLMFPRLVFFALPTYVMIMVFGGLLNLGADPSKEYPAWRRFGYRMLSGAFSFGMQSVIGCHFTRDHVSPDRVDYSEYLGPNWKNELKERKKPAPTIIMNHSSIWEVMTIHSFKEYYSQTAKAGMSKVPVIGPFLTGMQTLFI